MTPEERLAAIEGRASAATPDWLASGADVLGPPDECFLFCGQGATEADAAFAANARQDVPWLVGEVRRLRDALEDVYATADRPGIPQEIFDSIERIVVDAKAGR